MIRRAADKVAVCEKKGQRKAGRTCLSLLVLFAPKHTNSAVREGFCVKQCLHLEVQNSESLLVGVLLWSLCPVESGIFKVVEKRSDLFLEISLRDKDVLVRTCVFGQ